MNLKENIRITEKYRDLFKEYVIPTFGPLLFVYKNEEDNDGDSDDISYMHAYDASLELKKMTPLKNKGLEKVLEFGYDYTSILRVLREGTLRRMKNLIKIDHPENAAINLKDLYDNKKIDENTKLQYLEEIKTYNIFAFIVALDIFNELESKELKNIYIIDIYINKWKKELENILEKDNKILFYNEQEQKYLFKRK